MAVVSTGVTVGTSITEVSGNTAATFNYDRFVYLQSGTEGAATYAGGSNVSAANGILVSETNNTVFQLKADDVLYAISDTAGAVVKVLEVK
tara:strand:+ start:736 stop:1008 length:273 start_codon:yes stop_codon:yes gene_type:complete